MCSSMVYLLSTSSPHLSAGLKPNIHFNFFQNCGAQYMVGKVGAIKTAKALNQQRKTMYKNWKKYETYRDFTPHSTFLTETQMHPLLFLYSTKDIWIPYTFVQALVDHQRSRGRTVQQHDFVNSDHVMHYRTYPQMYEEKISEFMKSLQLNQKDSLD
jgi:hypothetical protein